jgi:hypothetical protein
MKQSDLDFYDEQIFIARLTMPQDELDEFMRVSSSSHPSSLFYSLQDITEYFKIRPDSYRKSFLK